MRAGLISRANYVVVLGLLCLGFVACGGETGEAGGDGDGLTPVTLMLNWTPNNHHAGIYVARDRGWYRDAGLDVRIVEPATSGASAVVGAGKADFGIAAAESVLPARAAGVPVVSIATLLSYNDSSLMSLAGSGITRPRDLEGKTYGGFGGPLERQLIDTLVACDGGDPSKVRFVDVGNVDYLVGMEQGEYDFVWVFEGWDTLRAREVAHKDVTSLRFADYIQCIPDWYTPVLISNESMLEEHPDTVRRFLDATARGYEVAIGQPEAAADALLRAVPELDATLVRASAEYHRDQYARGRPWGVQEAATWQAFEEFLRTSGLLHSPVDTSKAFTNDFLPDR